MLQIYWGHGIYGIESASIFYFGKHPSLLSMAEAAMLAGMIPAPDLRSPLKDCSRFVWADIVQFDHPPPKKKKSFSDLTLLKRFQKFLSWMLMTFMWFYFCVSY